MSSLFGSIVGAVKNWFSPAYKLPEVWPANKALQLFSAENFGSILPKTEFEKELHVSTPSLKGRLNLQKISSTRSIDLNTRNYGLEKVDLKTIVDFYGE